MFDVLYRWRIKPEKEQQFIDAWEKITLHFKDNFDSLGSKLHKGSDGLFYAYARWKSAEDRERAFLNEELGIASEQMRDAVEERFEEVILKTLADHWA